MKNRLFVAGTLVVAATLSPALARAATPVVETARPLCFVVVDPVTRAPIPGAYVRVEQEGEGEGPVPAPVTLRTGGKAGAPTAPFDTIRWSPVVASESVGAPTVVTVPLGATLLSPQQGAPPSKNAKPPVRDIYIKVTATRIPPRATVAAAGSSRSSKEISTFVNRASNDTRALTRGQSGVATDSNGQQHVRGEHAEVAFVVDGVPLPDTLSGRQGSVVVASTIENLDIITGGFAPEFGGQTAAVLNVATVPNATKNTGDLIFQGGNYSTFNSNFTASGPLGAMASYVLNASRNQTDNALEPQQPDNQTAHNAGEDESYFGKFRLAPSSRDTVTLTLSRAPGTRDLSNRTGLSARFASAGQGFGFLGLRNADGTRPDVTEENAGALGASALPLPSQEAAQQDIYQHEINEFGTLTVRHQLNARDVGQLAVVVLHSGQDVNNRNPAVDLNHLPVDSSIEYSPTASRSVYHYQVNADVSARRGGHQFKVGFLSDEQSGSESYQLIPGSQLALNELAALDAGLAPEGTVVTDAEGNPVVDVDGNPLFQAALGATVPTLRVKRSGFYRAAYLQDTWQASGAFTVNYGVRYDQFHQHLNLGQPDVNKNVYSPRLNFSYALAPQTNLRWSYNHLFNVPPLAQGAVLGAPIQPETLDQYDVSLERRVARGQTAKAAYYYKNIRNQVDTGLLIPGSQIGLYSAVNLQYGGVHGIEVSYEASPPGGVGFDTYLNYTYSIAKPNGVDNTGEPVPQYNDHDQRHTVGAGLAYLWKGGASAAITLDYGSGLASSPIPPDTSRIARTTLDLHLTTGPKPFGGRGGIELDVSNLTDQRNVINFQSAFSGTRFQQGRRILLSAFGTF